MKKIVLSLVFAVILLPVFCQYNVQIWQKLEINTTENLKKIILFNDQTIIFSNNHCWRSNNLINWEVFPIPESFNITPVVFKGKIYINSKTLIFSSSDAGETWQPGPDILWPYVSYLAANENTIFAFIDGKGATSYRSNDGENFALIPNLILPDGYHYPPTLFRFAKANGDTITGSTSHPYSMYGKFYSYDNGETWTITQAIHDILLTDVAFRFDGEMMEVGLYPAFDRYISSGYTNLFALGGSFYAAENHYYDFWLAGSVFSQNRSRNTGMIMANLNITDIFYCPEIIRALKHNGHNLIAVGDSGAVYVLGDIIRPANTNYQPKQDLHIFPDTSYVLGNIIRPARKDCQPKKDLGVFPNPSKGQLAIAGITPGEKITIFNNLGCEIMSFIPQGNEESINLDRLPLPGVYYLRQGSVKKKIILKR